MMSQFHSMSPERLGNLGELVCETIFKSSKLHYIPLCNMTKQGASLSEGPDEKTILPDFDVLDGRKKRLKSMGKTPQKRESHLPKCPACGRRAASMTGTVAYCDYCRAMFDPDPEGVFAVDTRPLENAMKMERPRRDRRVD